MRVHVRLNLRRLVLAVIALLSFGAILLKQSDQYLRVSAAAQSVVTVSAANYLAGPQARGSLVSVFGNNLSAATEKSQTNPGPTRLANVSVKVTDSANVTYDAELAYVDPKQINYVIPDAAATGLGNVVISKAEEIIAEGKLEIVDSKPALFSGGSGDRKLAVGTIGDNGANKVSLVNSDGTAIGIHPGSPLEPATVTLLGTGLRYAASVMVRVGDLELQPVSVRPDPDMPGVDQVAVRIPVTVKSGTNNISLVVKAKSSATTQSGVSTLAAAAAPADSTLVSNAVTAAAVGDVPPGTGVLDVNSVKAILAQAVAKAQQMNFPITAAVLDTEGNILGIVKMNGATSRVTLGATDLVTGQPTKQRFPIDPDGLEGLVVPVTDANGNPLAPPGILQDGAALGAISKAGTAAFFSTQGSAISTRTASSIIQENFPVRISSQSSGPLYGVQFSQLPCSDVRNLAQRRLGNLPFGLAGDPGGMPIYKDGIAVGGIGIEGDGLYSVDVDIQNNKGPNAEQSAEEIIATAAIKGFRVDPFFQADNLLIDGMRLEYSNVPVSSADGPPAASFDSLVGTVISIISIDPATNLPFIRGQQFSGFSPLTLGGVPGRVTQGFFPFMDSQVPGGLTAGEVNRILTQAARGAYALRAGIRRPVPQPTEVNITVIDTTGTVLGLFSTQDAPQFGFDVCVQKARTGLFFTLANTDSQLRLADAQIQQLIQNVPALQPFLNGTSISKYADAAKNNFGLTFNGQNAFTSRSMGFLARSFFPDGIPGTPAGPFSKPFNIWTPFNDGLQIALVKPALALILAGAMPVNTGCSPIPGDLTLANGFQIFAGSAALYRGSTLVGFVGVSGDGIDQDDFVASSGAFGFDPPANMRADQLLPLGVRLPYVKYPRHPNIGNPPAVAPIIRTSRIFSNTN
jgi:uncharacterized protein (TIGR03437 family)